MSNPIYSSDLYKDDKAISKAIAELEQLGKAIEDLRDKEALSAVKIIEVNKRYNATSSSGRDGIKKTADQVDKLEQRFKDYNDAIRENEIKVAALKEANRKLNQVHKLEAKLIQANTDTTSEAGREAIRKDINKLLEQLDNIAQQTSYNGITLLQGSYDNIKSSDDLSFQIGANKDDIISNVSIQSNTVGLGGGAEALVQTSGLSTQNNVISQGTSIVVTGDGTNAITLDGVATGTAISANISGITGDMTFSHSSTLSNLDSLTQLVLEELSAATGGSVSVTDTQGNIIGTFTLTSSAGVSASGMVTRVAGTTVNGITQAPSFTIASGTTIGFGGATANSLKIGDTINSFSIGSMQVDQTAASGTVTISATAQNVNIQNLNTANGKELDVTTVAGSITGGQTLSGLKALASGQLTKAQADKYQGVIDAAITQLNTFRSDLGSTQNQIESAVRNLMTQETNVKAAESIIRDVDYAEESATFNKQNIISQAGSYAMSQANAVQQNILRLLQ